MLAIELVALLHAEPTRKYATKDLASRLDTEVGSQAFREAVELAVRAGFAEWTTSGKIRAVAVEDLRASGMQFDNLDAALAGMSERLRVLGVSPLWMLHETGSADSRPPISRGS